MKENQKGCIECESIQPWYTNKHISGYVLFYPKKSKNAIEKGASNESGGAERASKG